MAGDPRIQYIVQQARAQGLDPEAVLAIASHEGLSGGIGDGGHAFGPFQMNNAGGVLTGKFGGMSPQQINTWAWSRQGIDHALAGIASVARGLKGRAAIEAIATKYERPQNPQAEITDALSHYGRMGAGSMTLRGMTSPSGGSTVDAGGSQSRQALAALLGGGGKIDFNSNQVQAPQLMQMAMLRQQLSASGSPTASAVGATPPGKGSPHVAPVAPGFKFGRVDQGVDVSQSSPYVSPGSGTVVRIGQVAGGTNLGVYVKLDHPVQINGSAYPGIYVWHTSPLVKPGQRVSAGQPIMSAGSAEVGFATSDGRPVAPLVGGLGAGTKPTSPGHDMLSFFHSR